MLNKIINICSIATLAAGLLIMSNANAADAGAYLGGQVGWGSIHQFNEDNDNDLISYSHKDQGVAGRLFAGYQINNNFAIETGITKFSNATFKDTESFLGTTYTSNGKIEAYAVDVVGKAMLPLQNGFGIYGKLGAAYLSEKASYTAAVNDPDFGTESFSGDASAHKVRPTFGAGVSYDINKNLVADLSWSHIQKIGADNNTGLENTDLVALGLAYHFG
jgi:OOP family OmpA-OmpF porin